MQLNMKIIVISSRHFIERREIFTKSDNIEIMIGSNNDEVISNSFDSLLERYQKDY